jgi:hypothetical protein
VIPAILKPEAAAPVLVVSRDQRGYFLLPMKRAVDLSLALQET